MVCSWVTTVMKKGLGKLVGTLPCIHSLGNLAVVLPSEGKSGHLFLQPAVPLFLALGPIEYGRNDSDPVLILALRKLLF